MVDDELPLVDILTAILEGEGYLVRSATSGAEGLAVYGAIHPDAVLLDMTVPVMDGLTALAEILKLDPRAQVATLTGVSSRKAGEDAILAGARAFILKPFDIDQIIKAVKGLLAI
jgi:CheY-like chemotaxis protein